MTVIETLPPRRRRRWPIYTVVILVILVVLGWLGYWFAAMKVAEMALTRATTAPIAGHQFGCPDRTLSGFPLRLDIRCQRVTLAGVSDGLAAALPGFAASAPLYRPGYVETTLEGPLVVNVPDRGLALTASWSAATATASAWLNGLNGGGAHFDGLGVSNTGSPEALPVISIAAKSADAGVAPAGGGDYRFTASAERLDLKRSDGGPFPEMDVSGSLVAEKLGTLGNDPAETLRAWAKAGGKLKIENIRLAASGGIVTASGELSLSDEGKLNGSLLLGFNSIQGLSSLVELIRPGTLGGDKANLGLQAISSLSGTIDTPDGKMQQTSLTFTDGVIWLSIFPLVGVDPIPPIHL